MMQYRASWKRLMPREWIREGLWVIPWMLRLCEGVKPQGKAELYAVPIGLPWKGLGEKWACSSGFVLTWVLLLQISTSGVHWPCRPPALPRRSSSLRVPCHRRYSRGGPWAKRAWFKRQEDGGRSGALQNTCLEHISPGPMEPEFVDLFLAQGQRDSLCRVGEGREMPHHWALGLCRSTEDRLLWGTGQINLDR